MRKPQLTQDIYRVIRAMVDTAAREGAPLPSERKMATDLSVSRTTIRRVLAHLASEKLLVKKHGETPVIPPQIDRGTLKIGLILPVLNTYTSQIVADVDYVLAEHGHAMVLVLTHGDPQVEFDRLEQLLPMLSGVFAWSSLSTWDQRVAIYKQMVQKNKPVVFLGAYHPHLPCDIASEDYARNAYLAAGLLLEEGADHLYVLEPQYPTIMESTVSIDRCISEWQAAGRGKAVVEHLQFSPTGVIQDEKNILEIMACQPIENLLRHALTTQLDGQCAGILCVDGFIAANALHRLRQWNIPEEQRPMIVSIGRPPLYDNAPELMAWTELQARAWRGAAELMIERIRGFEGPPRYLGIIEEARRHSSQKTRPDRLTLIAK